MDELSKVTGDRDVQVLATDSNFPLAATRVIST